MVLVLPRRLERAVALALPALGLHRIRKHTPINARQCAVSVFWVFHDLSQCDTCPQHLRNHYVQHVSCNTAILTPNWSRHAVDIQTALTTDAPRLHIACHSTCTIYVQA